MKKEFSDADKTTINTIRMLAVDAVEKANSGHPGMPMGAAPLGHMIWSRYLQSHPDHLSWPNRDRFVLSAGHGCMLQYALLHLAGFDVSLDDIKDFRQWGSKTPGHPEFGHTEGVECTTGPLGQGIGNAVGMALGARMLAAKFNTEEFKPITYRVFGICGDGDLMEGVSAEAASLAGHLGLGNLVFVYDDNEISIDGSTDIAFTEDVQKRFDSYGWHTEKVDGSNWSQLNKALETALKEDGKPSLIIAKTTIGEGSPGKANTAGVHGAPLGSEEVVATKANLDWPQEPTFIVPDVAKELYETRKAEVEKVYKSWKKGFEKWTKDNPERFKLWQQHFGKAKTEHLFKELCENLPEMPNATRSVSSVLQQHVATHIPSLAGGGADLDSSTKAILKSEKYVSKEDFSGRNIHFGVREHAMGAITNGMAYNGGLIPFSSTFLTFSDYMRPAIRLAALSKLQNIFIFTHDSFMLGEDGPTHQPVEHIPSLRLIPGLAVIRPADPVECAAAWHIALNRKNGPTAICLTRQKLPEIQREKKFKREDTLRGAYLCAGADTLKPDLIFVATGSELHLAMEAHKIMEEKGVQTRVVSAPCLEVFSEQSEAYQEMVLPSANVPTVAIEAAKSDVWHKWIGRRGLVIGMDRFGASAPDHVLAEKFDFTAKALVARTEKHFKLPRKKK